MNLKNNEMKCVLLISPAILFIFLFLVNNYETQSGDQRKLPAPANRHNLPNIISPMTKPSPGARDDARNLPPSEKDLSDIGLEEKTSILATLQWPLNKKNLSSVKEATNATKCIYNMIDLQENYTIGSRVQVVLVAMDGNGRPKTHGGDFFQAKLYNSQIKASTYGPVVDHLNGTYTIQFSLLWPGPAHVSIRLIHSSEAVQTIYEHRQLEPDKVFFNGHFADGNRTEVVACNAQRSAWLVGDSTKPNSVSIPSLTRTSTTHLGEPPSWPHYTPKEPCQSLRVEDFPFFNVSQDDRARNFSRRRFSRECRDGKSCCCQYRDPVTGESWFCRRPHSLPCWALTHHSMGSYRAKLSSLEANLLHKSKTNIVVPGKDFVIHVLPQEKVIETRPECTPGLGTPVPAGFYFQDRWTSLLCRSRSFPTAALLSACLKDKEVHMMGDSTLRQWFEYLESTVPTLKRLNVHTSPMSGPLHAIDPKSNTVLHWRAHGLPIRTLKTPIADIHYIGRELESIAGGEHTVIVFTIWAHFTTHPLENYIRRLATIRRAVLSMLQRAPRTLVVIKTANTGYKDIYGSDWLSWQLDLILRAMFRNLPVVFIDVWQMTSCHYSPDQIHPPRVVVSNEVDMFLSFVCPHSTK